MREIVCLQLFISRFLSLSSSLNSRGESGESSGFSGFSGSEGKSERGTLGKSRAAASDSEVRSSQLSVVSLAPSEGFFLKLKIESSNSKWKWLLGKKIFSQNSRELVGPNKVIFMLHLPKFRTSVEFKRQVKRQVKRRSLKTSPEFRRRLGHMISGSWGFFGSDFFLRLLVFFGSDPSPKTVAPTSFAEKSWRYF